MALRITNNLKTQNAKDNISRISERLNAAQKRLVTGKRINKPSDDPTGMRQVLAFRAGIASQGQFIRNAQFSGNFLQQTDSTVASLQSLADAAKSLAVEQASSLPDQKQRSAAADQVSAFISQALSLAKSKYGSRFIFGGQSTGQSPIRQNGSEITYIGDNREVQAEINTGDLVGLNLLGSNVFATDLNPNIDGNTLISSFHRGSGVPSGPISITNSLGASSTITLTANQTVGQVISAINSSGLGVTASINSAGDGISVTDTNANPTGNLVIQDLGNGATARELGIIGNATQTIAGIKAQPALTASSPLALLNGGNGLTLSDVSVVNGAASGTVTFGNASTVQDILNAFNNAGLNLNTTLNSAGNGLNIASTASGSVPVVLDIGAGTTASQLGLGGETSFFTTMNALKDALRNNDVQGIAAAMEGLGSVSQHLSAIRGTIGARVNLVQSNIDALTIQKENSTTAVALTENDDFANSATDLAALETALNASLATTSKIIQPTLVDFLR